MMKITNKQNGIHLKKTSDHYVSFLTGISLLFLLFSVYIFVITLKSGCVDDVNLSYISVAFTGVSLCNAAQTLFFENKIEKQYGFEYSEMLDGFNSKSKNRKILFIMRLISIVALLLITILYFFENHAIFSALIKVFLLLEITICCIFMTLWSVFSIPSFIDRIIREMVCDNYLTSLEELRELEKNSDSADMIASRIGILSAIENKLRNQTIHRTINNLIMNSNRELTPSIKTVLSLFKECLIELPEIQLEEVYTNYGGAAFIQMYDASQTIINLLNKKDIFNYNKFYAAEMVETLKREFLALENKFEENPLEGKTTNLLLSLYVGMVYGIIKSKSDDLLPSIIEIMKCRYNYGIRSAIYILFELLSVDEQDKCSLIDSLKKVLEADQMYNMKAEVQFLRSHRDLFINLSKYIFVLEEVDVEDNMAREIVNVLIEDMEQIGDIKQAKKSALANYIRL